jgi:aminoglycoside phosphotransferase (APT) family kinase protein
MAETLGARIGAGRVAELFAYGTRVIKLHRRAPREAVLREATNQATAAALGVPAPAVWGVHEVAGRWGIVMDRVEGASFLAQAQRTPAEGPRLLARMVELQLQLHGRAADHLVDTKRRLARRIADAAILGERRLQLLAALAAMPEGDRLCHGDFHPENILGESGRAWVIDWADATRGDAAADACRSYLILRHHAEPFAAPYLDAYCGASGAARDRVLAWLPFIAAARLVEDVPEEAERLLALAIV